jgi:hypothetical protein
MLKYRRTCIFSIIAIGLFFSFVGFGQATVASFTVQNGEEVDYPINLAYDDRVLIQFSVIGQTYNTIHFSITFPNQTVRDFGAIGDFHFSFICDEAGEYILNFMNDDSTENKLVTLNYEVDHYLFGMPQMLVMTIFIAVTCVGGVAVFIMLSKKPY